MQETQRLGAAYALAAYTFWGVAPVYFVWVAFAGPVEVLAQRLLWALPILAVLATLGRQWHALKSLRRRDYVRLFVCATLLAVNWGTFIYGIHAERINETSLGYFINPLVTIVLGALVLRERVLPVQWIAVGVAAAGVGYELVSQGTLPVVAMILACTFAVYGLLRKQIVVPAALGLGIESAMLMPFALAYMLLADLPSWSLHQDAMLALGGLVTVLPLVWFGAAAARLPLTTLGLFQYVAPSLSLLLAVFVYQEGVSDARWVSFAGVWVGILIFTLAGAHARRKAVLVQ